MSPILAVLALPLFKLLPALNHTYIIYDFSHKSWLSDLGDGIPREEQVTKAGPLELSSGVESMEAGHKGFVALI